MRLSLHCAAHLLPLVVGGCMAILPSSKTKSFLSVRNNETQNLPWSDSDTLKSNIRSPILEGACSVDSQQVVLQITGPNKSRILSSNCSEGSFRFHLNNTEVLSDNGVYRLSVSSTDKNGRVLTGPIVKTYDLLWRDLANEIQVTPPSEQLATAIPDVDFSGSCSENGTSYTLTLSRGTWKQSFACTPDFSWSFVDVPLELGSNEFLLQWVDDYGNTASRDYLVSRSDIVFVAGMVSAVGPDLILPDGETHSGNAAAPCAGSNKACLYWSTMTPLAAADSEALLTTAPYMSHDSDPSGDSWLSPGILGRIFNP